jgi:hypothetical protein
MNPWITIPYRINLWCPSQCHRWLWRGTLYRRLWIFSRLRSCRARPSIRIKLLRICLRWIRRPLPCRCPWVYRIPASGLFFLNSAMISSSSSLVREEKRWWRPYSLMYLCRVLRWTPRPFASAEYVIFLPHDVASVIQAWLMTFDGRPTWPKTFTVMTLGLWSCTSSLIID